MIACVAIIVATIVLIKAIQTWDPEEIGGKLFMCVISGILIIAAVLFIINGIKMVINGKKSLVVSKKGHSERIDLVVTEVTENNNGAITRYNIYTLKFEYADDFGNLCENSEQISEKFYNRMQGMQLPILVLGERAIFDRKKFEEENFMNN